MSLPIDWTKNLKPEDKKAFEEGLRSARWLTDRIETLLRERLEHLERKETSEKAYEDAAWAYKQADIVGAKREIKYLLSLFSYKK